MTVTRLTGGLTPGDGADPRTFPAIWNDTADQIEAQGTAITDLEDLNPPQFGTAVASGGQVLAYSTAVAGYEPVDVYGAAVNGTAVYRYVTTIYYTSNGTFSKGDYPWLRGVRVRMVGAGGGGGGCGVNGTHGGGGGGGAYVESFLTDIAGLSASVTVTIGAAGTGGASGANNGTSGGNTSFGTVIVAGGGGGGQSSAGSFVNNNGGTAVTPGDLNITGGHGEPRSSGNSFGATCGGSSILGFGGPGFKNASNLAGLVGSGYGAGGGGGRSENNNNNSGGNGTGGIMIVELYA